MSVPTTTYFWRWRIFSLSNTTLMKLYIFIRRTIFLSWGRIVGSDSGRSGRPRNCGSLTNRSKRVFWKSYTGLWVQIAPCSVDVRSPFFKVKRPGPEDDHSCLPVAKFKNERCCTTQLDVARKEICTCSDITLRNVSFIAVWIQRVGFVSILCTSTL